MPHGNEKLNADGIFNINTAFSGITIAARRYLQDVLLTATHIPKASPCCNFRYYLKMVIIGIVEEA